MRLAREYGHGLPDRKMAKRARAGTQRKLKALILVVDDFTAARDVYVRTFRAAGYDVEEAHNGEDALEKGLKLKPDLILMDLIMPGMDGWETIRRLKQQGEGLPIAVITGAPYGDGAQRAKEAGCDAYILKPVLPETLLRLARDLLSRRTAT